MKRLRSVIALLLAITLIAIGIYNDQFQSVLTKASKICLECVGIG